ncbi:MAG TPA: hypothetical protein VK017_10835 [Sphingobacterium sp.]|jgi:hypothetical protein|nr:hypothetical protein [Sphingobacterium sp.]
MNFNRIFQHTHNGNVINFSATYNPQTHFFDISEDDNLHYVLIYNPSTKVWSTQGGRGPSIPVEVLAELVQRSFGVYVA